jgi:hypothetical protein
LPGKFASVYTPGNNFYNPLIKLNLTDAMGTRLSTTFVPSPIVDSTIPGFSGLQVSLVGILSTPDIVMTDRKVRLDLTSNTHYLSQASEANVPTRGMLGDIQGSSVFAMTTFPSTLLTKFDPAIKGPTEYGFWEGGYQQTPKQELPSLFRGRVWYVESGKLISNDTGLIPILLRVRTTSSLSIVRRVAQVCPRLSVNSAHGCFTCPQGFSLNITASSACLPGLVVVTMDGALVSTQSISITVTDQTYLIRATSGVQHTSGTISLTSGTETVSASFAATLDNWVLVTNNTVGIIGTISPSNDHTGLGNFWDFLSNVAFANWTNSIISTLLTLFAVIGLVILFWKCFNRVLLKVSGKKKNSM